MPVDLVNVAHKDTGRKALLPRAALKYLPDYRETAQSIAAGTPNAPGSPARNASKAEWVDHAAALGVDRQEADGLTRDELAELYADPKES